MGETAVFDQREPEEWGEPRGREQGGLDVDRFREEAPPTGRGEEGQEGESSGVEDHRTSVTTKNKWEVVDLAVDSGPSETVISEDMLPNIPIKQGDASRRGVQNEVANGVRIPNFGEKKLQGILRKGPSGASPLGSAR